MAKRVPPGEKPFSPVDEALVRAVVLENSDQNSIQLLERNEKKAELSEKEISIIEKLNREKRVLLTKTEEHEVERIVARMAKELNTTLKFSHVLRAFITIFRNSEKEIFSRSKQMGPIKRPPNGDPVAIAHFDHRLAQIIATAISDAPQIK